MVHAGSKIAVRALGANKTSEAQFEYGFQAKQWYHIVLTHSTGSALAPAWVRLFVNGILEASERFKYPKVCIITIFDWLHVMLLNEIATWLHVSAVRRCD